MRIRAFVRLPCLPWRLVVRPQVFEVSLVAKRIHRVPEAVVEVDAELALGGEIIHRLFFPNRRIAFDIAADLGRQHEKTAIDPAAIAARLLLESRDARALIIDGAEAAGWLGRGDGGEAALAAMKSDA